MNRFIQYLRLVLGACLVCSSNFAQEAVGPFISTVGTTVREAGNGRDWAYILWTANNPQLLVGRSHAIYSKAGDANSPALFSRIAIVSLQSEAITLEPLLRRAVSLGENTNVLAADIDALFGKITPQNLTLPEKLSAIVRGGLQDPKHFGRMILLSRTHPSVAMALGFAHAELIPAGQTTFEVREFDRATQSDGAVIGRVTVAAGAPVLLPAPGAPAELKYDNARGHLNAQLRWATPDPLRRLSLLQHGFNVWRVRKDYADARNWRTTPPTPNTLLTALGSSTAVRRVNNLPLMTSKAFSPADVANFEPAPNGDPATVFVVDDNDRGRSNIVTTADFTNGARFVYFVTARDTLGRDGAVSLGTEVQICNKLPPDAVSDVSIANDSVWIGNLNRQRLRVNWPQAENLPLSEQKIKRYWIYRWKSVTDLRLSQSNPTNNLIAVVNHISGQSTNTYLDSGDGAPTPPADFNKTFYYTVRAEDDGACKGNLSPHSSPVFGVLRDRVGPAGPTGGVVSKCFDPSVRYLSRSTNITSNPGFDSTYEFNLLGLRSTKRITWMQFKAEVRPNGQTNTLETFRSGRLLFGNGAPGVFISFPFNVPGKYNGHDLYVTATAGFENGESDSTSRLEGIDLRITTGERRLTLGFAAELVPQAKDVPCDEHFTLGEADDLLPIEVNIQPTAGSKEVRVYRRVDDGPLDLIYQKPLGTLEAFAIPDDALPHGGGKVCYFASTVDEHGNASVLSPLGCKLALETSLPPRPQLSPITPRGSVEAGQMLLSWFCPSANVERFEVGIATLGDEISANCAPGYLQLISPGPNPLMESISSQIAAAGGLSQYQIALEFRRFRTPRPSSEFGSNDRFTVPVDIQVGRRYVVYVKSIATSGARSESSNMEWFYWQDIPAEQPNVPWPARPLPPVGNSFGMDFNVVLGPACGATNAPGAPLVRISLKGFTGREVECPQSLNIGSYANTDPNTLLPTNGLGDSIFPMALYRMQVANARFANVSGDLSQVSPLMETIAWGANGNESVIFDPFVHVSHGIFASGAPEGMYLRDTQPIISGSRYRYFLVRFSKLGEIAEVIPAANELEIP